MLVVLVLVVLVLVGDDDMKDSISVECLFHRRPLIDTRRKSKRLKNLLTEGHLSG